MESVESDIPGKLFDRKLIARMVAYVRPYAWFMLFGLVVVIPLTLLGNTLPLLVRDATDHYLVPDTLAASERWAGLWRIGKLYLLVGFGAFLFRFVQGYLLSWLGQKILFDMRADIFAKILRLPFRYFDRHPVGRLMTRIGSDVDAMQRLLTDGILGLTTDLLMLSGTLAYMFWVSPRLALIMLVLFPPLLVILFFLNHRVRATHRTVRLRQSSLNSYLQEMITGMTTVQLFNRQPTAIQRFEAAQRAPARRVPARREVVQLRLPRHRNHERAGGGPDPRLRRAPHPERSQRHHHRRADRVPGLPARLLPPAG
jgi:ATP-binding cassette subfamily B multidrug efflux pump